MEQSSIFGKGFNYRVKSRLWIKRDGFNSILA
jgi:hypothetical protein